MNLLRGLVFVLLVVVSTGRADTTWVASGNVSGVWNASGSPYMIHSGDITVATGQTLLINPGVKVYFAGQFKLVVNGLLQAIGTQSDSIWFTGSSVNFPYDSPTRWRGLRFVDAHEDCQLSYCSISYSGATGAGALSYGGGLYCLNTDILVEHSKIHRCHAGHAQPMYSGQGCGVYAENSDVEFSFTDIINNMPTVEENVGPVSSYGGGIYFVGGSLFARHCKIQFNSADLAVGGVYIRQAATATMDTCLITDNSTPDGSYTGMVIDANSVVSMTGTTIANHHPYLGYNAGLACGGLTLTMEACTLRNNQASWIGPVSTTGGAALKIENPIYARISNSVFEDNNGQYGAALLCDNTIIENCIFRRNSSSNGALFSNGGNKITDCLFEDNEANTFGDVLAYYGDGMGGGIWFSSGTDSVSECMFDGNYAFLVWELGWNGQEFEYDTLCTRGGAMYCDENASPYIVNCVFVNNSLDRYDLNGSGSVLYSKGGSPVMEFCTMYDNDASGGSFISEWGAVEEAGGVICAEGGAVTVKSCIMSHSTASAGVRFVNQVTANIHHSDFFDLGDSLFAGNVPANLGTVSTTNANGDACDEYYNIFLYPEYVDAVNGDLHLSNSSPCIGGADPFATVATDYENNARPLPSGSVRDMGAYESAVGGALMAVEDLTIVSSDEDQNDVVLRWNVVSAAQSYQIYSGEAQEYVPGMFNMIGTTADTFFVDSDVLSQPALQRTYVVRASVLP